MCHKIQNLINPTFTSFLQLFHGCVFNTGIGGGAGYAGLGMSPSSGAGSARFRAATEAVLVRHLAQYFTVCLEKDGTLDAFLNVEMPALVSLCRMELNGFGEEQTVIFITQIISLSSERFNFLRIGLYDVNLDGLMVKSNSCLVFGNKSAKIHHFCLIYCL